MTLIQFIILLSKLVKDPKSDGAAYRKTLLNLNKYSPETNIQINAVLLCIDLGTKTKLSETCKSVSS